MKVVVEWGNPKHATKRQICGISGQFTVDNPKQGRKLALQLFHTMTGGAELQPPVESSWDVSPSQPRKVVWSSDNSAWVAVSLLDGCPRGAYVGVADRDCRLRQHEENTSKLLIPAFENSPGALPAPMYMAGTRAAKTLINKK